MLGVEALAAQGVPSGPLLASAAFAGLRGKPRHINNIVAMKVFADLHDTVLRGLAGNAMHLHVAGVLIAWQLAWSAPALCRRYPIRGAKLLATVLAAEPEAAGREVDEASARKAGPTRSVSVGCCLKAATAHAD